MRQTATHAAHREHFHHAIRILTDLTTSIRLLALAEFFLSIDPYKLSAILCPSAFICGSMTDLVPYLDRKSLIVLCHSNKVNGRRVSGCGPLEPIRDYFRKYNARYIFLVDQPHPHASTPLEPTMEVYEDGELAATYAYEKKKPLWYVRPGNREDKTYIRLKLRDILATGHFFRLIRTRYPDALPIDFLFGVESINALTGDRHRRRMRIRHVVYYLIDWSPQRYRNPVMNRLFLFLDRLACKRADSVWNATHRVEEARRNILKIDPASIAPQFTVPWGTDFRQQTVKSIEQIDRMTVLYSGNISRVNGADLLPGIARVLADRNSRIRLLVTAAKGDDDLLEEIKAKIDRHGLRNIELLGFIEDASDLDQLMCSCAIGLAPYPDMPYSAKYYGDVSKVRTYFACGLVVVCTGVPPVSDEIAEQRLGIVTGFDAEEIAEAIVRLCEDDELYSKMRNNVIRKAQHHNWKEIYDKTFAGIFAGDGTNVTQASSL